MDYLPNPDLNKHGDQEKTEWSSEDHDKVFP